MLWEFFLSSFYHDQKDRVTVVVFLVFHTEEANWALKQFNTIGSVPCSIIVQSQSQPYFPQNILVISQSSISRSRYCLSDETRCNNSRVLQLLVTNCFWLQILPLLLVTWRNLFVHRHMVMQVQGFHSTCFGHGISRYCTQRGLALRVLTTFLLLHSHCIWSCLAMVYPGVKLNGSVLNKMCIYEKMSPKSQRKFDK